MKPWEQLTERGQAVRARAVVEAVLPRFGLTGARSRLLEVATNIVYRIDTPGGDRYVMKVDVTDEHPDPHVDLALEWLAAITAETDIPVVRHVEAADGSPYVRVSVPGVPPERRCVLYRWAPGRTIFEAPTPEHYRQLGVLTARLHEHARGHTPSQTPNRWDRVFYFPGEDVVIHDPEHRAALSDDQRRLVDAAIEKVEPVLLSLYEAPGRMIHADLHGWNVNVFRGRLTVLDFDDVLWGQPVHDLSITFGYQRDHDDYRAWLTAYEQGYRSVAEWPIDGGVRLDEHPVVRALMVARRLMFTNYVLTLPGDWSEQLSNWTAMFREYLGSE